MRQSKINESMKILRELLDILNEKGIPLHISQKSIMKDFEAAMQ
jgi:hypothetical protein